ncbi:MAG: phosphatase PAP2 family protein [Bacteroidetes bacterium]|nr:MAG: phosphatase PAP2 family protein [Bacteroidota bacterium]MBL1144991.1 phosphatase PAP2 family protein [Bacteroidota bacterium]NOG57787.1 phosphatase PAP2 family protein [Bacteroidota bacterium]
MIEFIKHIDQELLLLLNSFHSESFDSIMWFISGKFEWIPFYLFLIFLIIKKFKKDCWIILIAIALLITLSDQISVRFFKNVFERYRPCHNIEIGHLVHLVNNKCGGMYGFVSSHATNSFAIATFILLLLRKDYKWITATLIFWASLVSYSRIYLGVHYPADIIAGAILGFLIAYLLFYFLKKIPKLKLYKL